MLKTSPVLMMKAKKNPVEAEAMMVAHLNDSVALCDFISLMVEEVSQNTQSLSTYRCHQFTRLNNRYQQVWSGMNLKSAEFSKTTGTNRAVKAQALKLSVKWQSFV